MNEPTNLKLKQYIIDLCFRIFKYFLLKSLSKNSINLG